MAEKEPCPTGCTNQFFNGINYECPDCDRESDEVELEEEE